MPYRQPKIIILKAVIVSLLNVTINSSYFMDEITKAPSDKNKLLDIHGFNCLEFLKITLPQPFTGE